MVELFEQDLQLPDRHSSKGNQLKWQNNGIWYKADYTGYEGLAEYVISALLEHSSLDESEYVKYNLTEISYKGQIFNAACSRDMLHGTWQIITLERLFKNKYNQSLHKAIWSIHGEAERLQFLCDETQRITGLKNFGEYMAKLLTIDAFFKNEDRHTHNIAVLMNSDGEFNLCPIFDNGASLLSDIKMDYPLSGDIYRLMYDVKAKTISTDFDEQLDAAEKLYGRQIGFNFTKRDVDTILAGAGIYSEEIIERVRTILYQQMRKYAYLWQ